MLLIFLNMKNTEKGEVQFADKQKEREKTIVREI